MPVKHRTRHEYSTNVDPRDRLLEGSFITVTPRIRYLAAGNVDSRDELTSTEVESPIPIEVSFAAMTPALRTVGPTNGLGIMKTEGPIKQSFAAMKWRITNVAAGDVDSREGVTSTKAEDRIEGE